MERTAEGYYLEVSQRLIDKFISVSEFEVATEIETLSPLMLRAQLKDLKAQLKRIQAEKKTVLEKSSLTMLINEETSYKAQIKQAESNYNILRGRQSGKAVNYQVVIPFDDQESGVNVTLVGLIMQGLSNYVTEQRYKKGSSFRYSPSKDQSHFIFTERLRNILSLSVSHLSPNRTHQARLYYTHDRQTEINDIINEFARLLIPNGSTAERFLKRWLGKDGFDLGEEVIVTLVKGEASSIELVRFGHKTDLADMGFGTGQLLTMLLKIVSIIHLRKVNLGVYAENDERIVLIEEPESNLHPKLQSRLAEMFLDAASNHGIQFILETHSEYLIREVQALVKEINSGERFFKSQAPRRREDYGLERKSEQQPFKVYYFDDKQGPYEMRFREDGKFIDEFGSGFFDESRRLAFKIL